MSIIFKGLIAWKRSKSSLKRNLWHQMVGHNALSRRNKSLGMLLQCPGKWCIKLWKLIWFCRFKNPIKKQNSAWNLDLDPQREMIAGRSFSSFYTVLETCNMPPSFVPRIPVFMRNNYSGRYSTTVIVT